MSVVFIVQTKLHLLQMPAGHGAQPSRYDPHHSAAASAQFVGGAQIWVDLGLFRGIISVSIKFNCLDT